MSLPLTLMRKAMAAGCLTLGVLLGCFAVSANAAQGSGQFYVTATLLTAATAPSSVFCRSSSALAFSAIVTVVCATGEVVDITAPARGIPWAPGGAYHYIMQGSYAGSGVPDAFDGFVGPGTAASWRIIQLVDRDYLELLVGW